MAAPIGTPVLTARSNMDGPAELPRLQVENPTLADVDYSTTHTVGSGKNFPTISLAVAHVISSHDGVGSQNHKLVVSAGETFDETLTYTSKTGEGWIDLISSGRDSLAGGVRVANTQTGYMFKHTSASDRCLQSTGKPHHLRYIGAELYSPSPLKAVAYLRCDPAATQLSDEAHHIVFDRCYLHGHATNGHRGMLEIHGRHIGVVNSLFEDMWATDDDQSAALGARGSGPYVIDNTGFSKCRGIVIFFGGGNVEYSGELASDITITRNYFTNPPEWCPYHPSYVAPYKQGRWYMEFKHGRRVLVEGNLMEHTWYPFGPFAISPKNEGMGALYSDIAYDHTTRYISCASSEHFESRFADGWVCLAAGGNWIRGIYRIDAVIDDHTVHITSSPTTGDVDATGGVGGFALSWPVGVQDVTMRYNWAREVNAGPSISSGVVTHSQNGDGPTIPLNHFSMHDNLWDGYEWEYDDKENNGDPAARGAFELGFEWGVDGYVVNHNTAIAGILSDDHGRNAKGVNNTSMGVPSGKHNFTFTNNLYTCGKTYPGPTNTGGYFSAALTYWDTASGDSVHLWNRNALLGGPWPINGHSKSEWTTDSGHTEAEAEADPEVGRTDGTYLNGANSLVDEHGNNVFVGGPSPYGNVDNYVLADGCHYKGAGTDGKDLGCDCAKVKEKTAGCVSGSW